MDYGITELLKEWEFIRKCTSTFVEELTDEELDRALPRKGLDTIRKHFCEMVEVQKDFTLALTSLVMRFNGGPDAEVNGNVTKDNLLEWMKRADNELAVALENVTMETEVRWFGEQRGVAYHLAALISHESLHIGQIIAFCYALGMQIPQFVTKHWALSGR